METQTEEKERADWAVTCQLVINKSLLLTLTAQLAHLALKFVFIVG